MTCSARRDTITLFLAGDLMLGRGIDQLFPESCSPLLHESYVTSAVTYVELAERAHDPIPRGVNHTYVWGDALHELERASPDARIVNLETSVTTSERAEPKGINYRMHPANLPALLAAKLDCVALANNHVMDWGEEGLVETLERLKSGGILAAGAGRDAESAWAPAVIDLGERGRVLVFALGAPDCGIPASWSAGPRRPGVARLPDLSAASVARVAHLVQRVKRPGDLVVASVHWGGNWGYRIPGAHRFFAHELLDRAGVDLIHGHSSHHPRAAEVHAGHLVLYGCGELLNDYEGIRGHEEFRGDLVLAYLPRLEPGTGRLVELGMTPFRIRRFRLEHPPAADREWLRATLSREYRPFGAEVSLTPAGRLRLERSPAGVGAQRAPGGGTE
jgi:poly-gamma-glutamate capsule biosynthesis protein CapA/YwtB (metallophosphatase superfamily)